MTASTLARPTPQTPASSWSAAPGLRLVPCGEPEPPLEPAGTDGALALAEALAARPSRPALRLVADPPLPAARAQPGGGRPDEVGRFARTFVLAALEAVAGQRPLPQLARATTPDVYADLQRWCRRRPHRARPAVRSVHVGRPSTDAAEVCAVVVTGERVSAVALRLEQTRAGWRCSALELG